MTKLAKILSLVLALTMLCSVAFAEEVAYVRGDDDEYERSREKQKPKKHRIIL